MPDRFAPPSTVPDLPPPAPRHRRAASAPAPGRVDGAGTIAFHPGGRPRPYVAPRRCPALLLLLVGLVGLAVATWLLVG